MNEVPSQSPIEPDLPILQMRQLRVLKSGQAVYDQRFHNGVNIIRGENGSGKSTIADFMFYILGGEFENWKKVPAQCDEVQAEILTTRGALSLKREVGKRKTPIRVFFGTMAQAADAGLDGWQRFPLSRQGEHESFSQMMFRSMYIPEAQSEGASNITMHQMLRLLYSDQHTPPGRLFRFESQWDTRALRTAVGNLICGVDDYESYEISLKIRDLENEFDEARRALSALISVLPSDEALNNPDSIASQISQLEREREEIDFRISRVDEIIDESDVKAFVSEGRAFRNRLEKTRKEIDSLERDISRLDYDLEDIERYLGFLNDMIEKVQFAEQSSLAIGSIEFSQCPACLSELQKPENEHTCHVCGSETDPESQRSRYNVIRLDFEMQLRESLQLQSQKTSQREEAKRDLRQLLSSYKKDLSEFTTKYDTGSAPREAYLAEQNLRAGQIGREVEYLTKSLDTAEKVRALSERKADIQSQLETLKSRKEALDSSAFKRKRVALTRVSDIAASILRDDNKEQPEFKTAQNVAVDFADDAMLVDGDLNFAESSNVILKNACILSLFLAAGEDRKFYHPRFALFDNIEDKGMQVERSHNFQRIIVERATELQVPYQVIFTTSMMNPELELEDYVIGPHYTPDERSLAGLS